MKPSTHMQEILLTGELSAMYSPFLPNDYIKVACEIVKQYGNAWDVKSAGHILAALAVIENEVTE